MKKLSDGTKVNSMTYYFLLDWNDRNNKIYITTHFSKQKLMDLNIQEYENLFKHVTKVEHYKLTALVNER